MAAAHSQRGFAVFIIFLFLDSAETCVARVQERKRKGGHGVPETDIRRRFDRSLRNFWLTYRFLADDWAVVYNASSEFQDVAFGARANVSIRDEASSSDSLILWDNLGMTTETPITHDTFARLDEIIRIGRRTVRKAQDDSRRLGVPNVYSINGFLYYELPSGELSRTDPLENTDAARD